MAYIYAQPDKDGVPMNITKALGYFKKAAELGDTQADANAGSMMMSQMLQMGEEVDIEDMESRLKSATQQGHLLGMIQLAKFYEFGLGKDGFKCDKSVQLKKVASEQAQALEDRLVAFDSGLMDAIDEDEHNEPRALRKFLIAAETGSAIAQAHAAYLLKNQIVEDEEPDAKRQRLLHARNLFERAMEQGLGEAGMEIHNCYSQIEGWEETCPLSEFNALRALIPAAFMSQPTAVATLSMALRHGNILDKDDELAEELLEECTKNDLLFPINIPCYILYYGGSMFEFLEPLFNSEFLVRIQNFDFKPILTNTLWAVLLIAGGIMFWRQQSSSQARVNINQESEPVMSSTNTNEDTEPTNEDNDNIIIEEEDENLEKVDTDEYELLDESQDSL
eukprot:TRINITY_DN2722_c0_g2_i3.p1 TRINITY_DN2722_c0_g2~~TRINITY_DN2722_c0_g2_i3.p1  ORF type:complete len:452 (+),score=147.29 TRINITY_DN2722_c0_g2_i3:181-1356(+)